ncbi:MAG TPA: gephyrin-like molybdotransferase Glp [Acidobacteriota bacterium]|nr:gephyrin-like molybdotransferase Glp [Acidobacteriota bacterium]
MIEFTEARELVLSAAKALPAEIVPLSLALGRTLARDVRAREDIPPFTKATMDGFALRAGDATAPPAELAVVDDLPAGRLARRSLGPGQAARIMTGAPLPEGADAVVMVEGTERSAHGVIIRSAVRPGDNIGRAGEDLKKGETALARGAVIGPAEIGMLAAANAARVAVVRRPRVAVIATGDEIVEPGESKRRGQIRNSNGWALTALAVRAGAEARYLGIARDRSAALASKLRRARAADVIVLSGGVSVGDHDLVKEELRASGVRPVFWRVRIKPGKPVFFGRRGRQLVFGLPGNPTSAMVTFRLFVEPALARMLGRTEPATATVGAELAAAIDVKPGRTQFLRGIIVASGPVLKVAPYDDQRSGVLRSMVRSRLLIVVPADAAHLDAGRVVEVLFLDGRP